MANTQIAFAFPPDNISPKEKQEKKWGLANAKAIFYHNAAYGPAMFYNKAKE